MNKRVNVNVESKDGVSEVTVLEEDTNVDIGRDMLESGLATFRKRPGASLQAIMSDYAAMQQVPLFSLSLIVSKPRASALEFGLTEM